MKKLFTILSACFITFYSFSQSNPIPYVISNGEYRFEGFEATDIAEYPASMTGWAGAHFLATTPNSAPVDLQAKGDIGLTPTDGGSDLNKLMINAGAKGISIRGGSDNADAFAVVLSLNTIGAKGINITWKANPIHAYVNGTSALQLQYRIGHTGNWANLDSNEYLMTTEKAPAGQTQLEGEVFGPTPLPTECEGKDEVQLRWMIYYINPALNGTDNRVAVDSIVVTTTTAQPQSPNADFKSDKDNYLINEIATFTDLTAGSPNKWAWDFGDGSIDSIQNPLHTYTTGGVYTVKLIAFNSAGSDTMTKVDYITVIDPNQGISSNNKLGFGIYPNPSFGSIKFNNLPEGNYSLKMVDVQGKTVLSIIDLNKSKAIQLENIKNGLYTVQLNSNGKVYSQKFILNR